MKVVDLRNLFTNCNDRLIEVCGDLIYYAEEKNEEGHHNLFLLEYNQTAQRERILTSYFLIKPTYSQHFYSFTNEIMVVLEDGENDLRVLRIDKQTGAEIGSAQFSLVGCFADCVVLDEERLLVYTTEDSAHYRMFKEYRQLTGLSRVAILYDLGDESCSYLRDPRICNASSNSIISYEVDGERHILVLQPHGTEEEKEKSYADISWLGNNVNDDVWLAPLLDFVVSAKAGEPHIPLELILSAGTAGLVRYIGMSETSLYFRMKYFPKNDQRLCAINKSTQEKHIEAKLNLEENEKDSFFHIDTENGCAYKITQSDDTYTVEGVMNSNICASYNRELGDFVACVEDQFIVARYILSDEHDSFTFHTVHDVETGEQQSFEGSCEVKKDMIILY